MKKRQWFLYIIRCNNGRLYTGITTDGKRRFEEHKKGDKRSAKYLRGKGPLEMVMIKKIGERGLALKIEAKVKKLPKIKKEMLIEGKITVREIMKNLNAKLNKKRPINYSA
ncbi:MAG: GIY-YIG nuclease family protein [Candidatus Kuenenia sp.]|nr:GIY-YIG nuclease family protein [Candidatus Kuenenia hertensis]